MNWLDCTINFRVVRDGYCGNVNLRADLRSDVDLVEQARRHRRSEGGVMDRTVCGMCGCWIGDDLHAEIKHLRAERDALKNGSLWLEASAANTALRGKIENLRAEREELLSLLTAARDDVADALYIMASDASTAVLVEQRALLERIDAAMAAERE